MHFSWRGFTLIELLIVVAIIAILAAIAVPNFLEAQTRSKVSRVKADMRSLTTAVEAYRIDHNVHPPNSTTQAARGFPQEFNGEGQVGTLWVDISTPIAYITNCFLLDVFNEQGLGTMEASAHTSALFIYQNLASQYCAPYDAAPDLPNHQTFSQGFCESALLFYGSYRLGSLGPDMLFAIPGAVAPTAQTPYDATNGTVSPGNIWRGPGNGDNIFPNPNAFPGLIGGT